MIHEYAGRRLRLAYPAMMPPIREQRRAAMYKSLEFSIRDRVARVRFTTPDSLNSISEDRITDLQAVVRAVREDAAVRALSITGSGRAFCVGLDFNLLKKAFADISYFESVVRRLNAVLLDIEELPVPVIAAVNGYARAGGFELALACDFILIADEALSRNRHGLGGAAAGHDDNQRAAVVRVVEEDVHSGRLGAAGSGRTSRPQTQNRYQSQHFSPCR